MREFLRGLLRASPSNRFGCYVGDPDPSFWAALETASGLGFVDKWKPEDWDEIYITITPAGFAFAGLRRKPTLIERLRSWQLQVFTIENIFKR